MKWQRTLTHTQAALLAVGLDSDLAEAGIDSLSICHELAKLSREAYFSALSKNKISGPNAILSDCNRRLRIELLKEAREIDNALCNEMQSIENAQFHNKESDSLILIEKKAYKEGTGFTDISKHQMTKESVANWFYRLGDLEKAKKIIPNFTPKVERDLSLINALSETKVQLETANKQVEDLKRKLELLKKTSSQKKNSKPYLLIAQLIKIILPDADFQKTYQVYSQLNQKLSGSDALEVSEPTLKKYLDEL